MRSYSVHVDHEKFELVVMIDGEDNEFRFMGTDEMLRFLRSKIQEDRYTSLEPAMTKEEMEELLG